MFTYEAKPRQQVEADTEARFNPWPKGDYEFEITEAQNTTTGPESKNPGTPMLKLNLTVYNDQGHKRGVYDNLLGSYPDKIMGFCDAIGWEYGKPIDPNMIRGKTGRVHLKIQPAREYNGKSYEPSNVVSYYVKRKPGTASPVRAAAARQPAQVQAAPAPSPAELDDEIPF